MRNFIYLLIGGLLITSCQKEDIDNDIMEPADGSSVVVESKKKGVSTSKSDDGFIRPEDKILFDDFPVLSLWDYHDGQNITDYSYQLAAETLGALIYYQDLYDDVLWPIWRDKGTFSDKHNEYTDNLQALKEIAWKLRDVAYELKNNPTSEMASYYRLWIYGSGDGTVRPSPSAYYEGDQLSIQIQAILDNMRAIYDYTTVYETNRAPSLQDLTAAQISADKLAVWDAMIDEVAYAIEYFEIHTDNIPGSDAAGNLTDDYQEYMSNLDNLRHLESVLENERKYFFEPYIAPSTTKVRTMYGLAQDWFRVGNNLLAKYKG